MKPARALLFEKGMALVDVVARRVHRRIAGSVEKDEIEAIGRAALVEIVTRFDPERGPFEAFVAKELFYRIHDALRANRDSGVRRRSLALTAAQQYADAVWEADGGAPTSIDEVPTEADAKDKLAELLSGHAAAMALALSRMTNEVEAAADASQDPEEHAVSAEIAERLRGAVSNLPVRERALVERFYYRDEQFDEIARDLGISKSWASRLHAQAIKTLAQRVRGKLDISLGASALG